MGGMWRGRRRQAATAAHADGWCACQRAAAACCSRVAPLLPAAVYTTACVAMSQPVTCKRSCVVTGMQLHSGCTGNTAAVVCVLSELRTHAVTRLHASALAADYAASACAHHTCRPPARTTLQCQSTVIVVPPTNQPHTARGASGPHVGRVWQPAQPWPGLGADTHNQDARDAKNLTTRRPHACRGHHTQHARGIRLNECSRPASCANTMPTTSSQHPQKQAACMQRDTTHSKPGCAQRVTLCP
jgi:hypothetical protein